MQRAFGSSSPLTLNFTPATRDFQPVDVTGDGEQGLRADANFCGKERPAAGLNPLSLELGETATVVFFVWRACDPKI